MADFVAILKKTIEGQGVTTADIRARVYSRARQTIEQKLNALVPTPSIEQKARQMRALDDAIAVVEQSFAQAPVEVPSAKPVDPLDAFIAAAEASNKSVAPRIPEMRPLPTITRPTITPAAAVTPAPRAVLAPKIEPVSAPRVDVPPAKSSGGSRNLLWGLLGVVIAGAAGYGAYLKRDEIATYYANFTAPSQPEIKKVTTTSVKPADPATEVAKVEPVATPATPAKTEAGEQKFTQRLQPDGQEVDAGPATVAAGVGEGETVAPVTTPPSVKPAAPETPVATETPAPVDPVVVDPAAPATPAVPAATIAVGQKAVFYEEKTGTDEGTVDQGAVVWSVIQDSPGADQPEEPAIRAEVDVPEKGIKLKLTIKRNGDKTLPASHIIEMAFSVPEGFQGGSIDGVQRVTFKDTEQAGGSPLVGVPANFGDGFFLIALTDEKSAIENNLALMTRQTWIDIPLTYKSGRRALISIEKGIPGDKVFQEVLKAWQAKASG